MISDLHVPEFDFHKAIRWSLCVGAVGVVAVILGWIFQPQKFYQAYLLAWMFWLGVTMGCMGIVMLHHLMGGNWGFMVRRMGEHAGMTLPLLFVLFIPILIGMHSLYPWDRASALASDAKLRHDAPYLNPQFFCWRAVIYGAIWLSLAWYLRSASLRYDRTLNEHTKLHLHNISAGGMVIYFISMSMASVDWVMSLEAHWASTVFGFITVMGQALGGLCVLVGLFTLMTNTRPFRERAQPEYLNDLGNLMLTLVILWTYMAFAQLLVVWMGYKQDDISWYVHRLSHGWLWVGLVLVLLHFFVPFIILLMRELKRKARLMLCLCCGLLVLRGVNLFWEIVPSGGQPYPTVWSRLSWMDFVLPVGMGGFWVAMLLWLSLGHPLMPAGVDAPVADAAALES